MSHKVTPKQFRAMQLMARGYSLQEVSRQLKLRRETLSRWKKKPEFQAYFEEMMAQQRATWQQRLEVLVDDSIQRVQTELRIPSDPKRIHAALNVLKMVGIGRIVHPDGPENGKK